MAAKAAGNKTSRQARKIPVELEYPINIEALYKDAPPEADLSDILDVSSLKSILETVTKMTGMATAILDVEGNILVATGWQDICTKFHRVSRQTSDNCTESDLFLAENVRPGEYMQYKCKNGLWDVVTPLYIGARHAGNIYTGQFFYDDDEIDVEYFVRQAAKYGFDKEDYLAAMRRVPRVTHEHVKNLMDFLVGFTDMVARQGRHDLNLKKAIEKGRRIQADLALSERHYRELFENMLEGFALCRMIFDEKGQAIDWEYLDVNASFGRLTGLSNVVGKKISQVLPAVSKTNPELFAIYGRVAKTGAPHEFETLIEPLDEWLHISVFSPEEGHFVAVFEDITERKKAEGELLESHKSLEESFIGLVKALSATVETRDPYTSLHQKRVTELAMAMAKEAGLSDGEADGLYMAGLIHDIGKIYVPGEVLSKPGKLSDIEYRLVKTHSDAGHKIVEGINFKRPVADIVHQHHERLDGSGYPRGLKDKEILTEAKILAVADVVEAMASHRPYRPALGIDAALAEIKKNRGILYDPKIVDICVSVFSKKGFKFSD